MEQVLGKESMSCQIEPGNRDPQQQNMHWALTIQGRLCWSMCCSSRSTQASCPRSAAMYRGDSPAALLLLTVANPEPAPSSSFKHSP